MSMASRVKDRFFKKVFVVHGRNLKVRDAMVDFLTALKLDPIEWIQAVKATGKASPYVGEILDAAFNMAGAIVVLLTPDDEGRLRPEFHEDDDPPHEKMLTAQARPNVILEAGMGLGRHPTRTILVEIGQIRPISDVAGRHTVRFKGTPKDRLVLKERLKTAGCPVQDDGERWLTAGNFVEALKTILPYEASPQKDSEPEFEGPRVARGIKWFKFRGSSAWEPCCPVCSTSEKPVMLNSKPQLRIEGSTVVKSKMQQLDCARSDCRWKLVVPIDLYGFWTKGEFGIS